MKPKKLKLNPIGIQQAATVQYLLEHLRWLTGMTGKPQHQTVKSYEKALLQDEEKKAQPQTA